MGFTSIDKSMFSKDMPQTSENVRKVLDVAGWRIQEAADETGIAARQILLAVAGQGLMHQRDWQRLLDKAGRRAFDHDEDAA